jgi:hypothetical protein
MPPSLPRRRELCRTRSGLLTGTARWLAALKVLSGFDADLTHECTRAINRLRSLLLQIFPALERCLPQNHADPVPSPGTAHQELRADRLAGCRTIQRAVLGQEPQPEGPGEPGRGDLRGIGEQTITVIGTEAVELVIPRVAAQIKELNLGLALVLAFALRRR